MSTASPATTGDAPDARKQLLERPWSSWRDAILVDLATPHPDLRAKTTRIDITRYGHAMAVPTPGTLLQTISYQNRQEPSSNGASLLSQYERITPRAGRLRFAHADWSGYSVFEEAFTRGHAAGSVPA